ncbi:protein Atg16l2-like isoform X2 [Brachionichthys hirsutus]|uniref:protein Atg16l2-like isoform X2 n=1 Tax=Brachionichthys hirsutus TaxID=412623 RepID=UPI0036053C31
MKQPGLTAPGGGAAETWRTHVVRQLKHRDRVQHATFRDLICFYTRLMEKSSLTKGIVGGAVRRPSCSISSLLHQNTQLKTTMGELAFQVVDLQQQLKVRDAVLEQQHARLSEEKRRWAGVLEVRRELQVRVEQVQEDNRAVKVQYDALLQRQGGVEARHRAGKVREGHLLEDVIQLKRQAAAHMNNRNERRSRAREAKLQKELQTAARSKVTVDRCTSRKESPRSDSPERGRARLFRSASVSSPRIFTSMKELFGKRRGHSVCCLEEDLMCPPGTCLSARVPVRALQEAHEQDINAVRFCSSSDLLATGGTDRVIKLWTVRAGSLTHTATLDGSGGGITCIDFSSTGRRVLAASYDNSAMLWQRDESVPKVTLTGHSRKVTAARFSSSPHQVLTGSADGTIRLWDLHRAACVQEVKVGSYCSDVVCSHNCIISGHYDSKIRVWDSRTVSCVEERPARGKVTSLDISCDHRRLLSCCRDDCLQLMELREWSKERLCFRAEGFKCFSDSTKAVISTPVQVEPLSPVQQLPVERCRKEETPFLCPDGCFLTAGSADGAVYIWNVSTGNLETRLPDKHSSPISAVSWSPSGEYVVSVGKNRLAVLWSDV